MIKKTFWSAVLILFLILIPPVWYLANLPDTALLKTTNPKTSAIRKLREEQISDRGGKPHSFMEWRSIDQISPYLMHAVLLAEDDTFFQHHGFDIEALKRAMQTNWERKRFAFGGSTITQQLARTLYLSPHKSLLRKAKEALITRELEKNLPKQRILEIYLNVVEWGPQVYGAEAASEFFYHKPALDLTPDEAIALAAILPSPQRWNPSKETGFMGRRKAILTDRMLRARYIPATEPAPTETPEDLSPPPELEQLTPEEDQEPGFSFQR